MRCKKPGMKCRKQQRTQTVYKESLRNLVLRILLDGPLHGYEIMKRIEEVTNERWKPAAGTLYPLLEQLVEEGLIEVAEIEVNNVRGGRRIAYQLTDKGLEEATRIIKEAAKAKFDFTIFYIVRGARALRNYGLEDEYREICSIIKEGFSKLGVAIDENCQD